jgi:predicted dienelactone hydrolase
LKRLAFRIAVVALALGSVASGGEVPVPRVSTSVESTLPSLKGKYAVGVRSFAWIDEARSETATADEDDHREVTVQIWYPATAGERDPVASYFPELEDMLAAAADLPEKDRNFIQAHAALRSVATNSVPGAPLVASAARWPVILFSPGGNVSRHAQTALAERIAGEGFVFVSMAHPYSTLDVAPGSGFSMSIDWGINQEDEAAAAAADDRLADILAGDAAFVLDRLRWMARDGHAFAAKLDLDHVGIAGHSRGGTTVGRACGSNSSFVACAVLDNIGPDRESRTGVSPPFMTLRSPWSEERVAVLHDYLRRTGSVAHDVELADSNHFTCTDLPLFLSDLRVEGVEPGDGIASCATIVTAFFDAYLKRRISPEDAWVPPVEPGKATVRRFRKPK